MTYCETPSLWIMMPTSPVLIMRRRLVSQPPANWSAQPPWNLSDLHLNHDFDFASIQILLTRPLSFKTSPTLIFCQSLFSSLQGCRRDARRFLWRYRVISWVRMMRRQHLQQPLSDPQVSESAALPAPTFPTNHAKRPLLPSSRPPPPRYQGLEGTPGQRSRSPEIGGNRGPLRPGRP